MLPIKLNILLFLMICHVSYNQRRIQGGRPLKTNKPYVVYLVKATISDRKYDSWLCGGAIVNADFIITSAACIEDVGYLYAVAGYDKYISDENIENDKCTRTMKKKVVFTCVPISYDFEYDNVEKWAQIDIGLARVESPYDFTDPTYLEVCSYIPNQIAINYELKYQKPSTDCMVMGWGHEQKWRKRHDNHTYNSEVLKYTPTLILDKSKCVLEYEYYPKMKSIIEQYMICTLGAGTIDDGGDTDDHTTNPLDYSLLDGCSPEMRMGQQNSSCYGQNDGYQSTVSMNARREAPNTNRTFYNNNYTTQSYIKKAAHERRSNQTRRNGICQNDHGGPLVTWVGTTEVLIGVASVFQVDNDSNCIGPFLHTSTQSNGAFLDCVINEWGKKKGRRSALCDSPPHIRGFDVVEAHISWKDHPAGPAENELLEAKFGPYENFNEPPQM